MELIIKSFPNHIKDAIAFYVWLWTIETVNKKYHSLYYLEKNTRTHSLKSKWSRGIVYNWREFFEYQEYQGFNCWNICNPVSGHGDVAPLPKNYFLSGITLEKSM